MNNYRVLVLGYTGMLGNAVYKYLSDIPSFNLFCIDSDLRFSDQKYKDAITQYLKFDFIINCCGAINQRTYNFSVNYELPEFLLDYLSDTNIIHISTDCVWNGLENYPYSSNTPTNGETPYALSKIKADELILSTKNNCKILRTSILGIDKNKSGLLSWFLSQKRFSQINGFGKEIWQGITTLKLAQCIEDCILNWEKYNKLTLISSKYSYSKYDLLYLFREMFDRKDLKLVYDSKTEINRSLVGDIITEDVEKQLKELKRFYNL